MSFERISKENGLWDELIAQWEAQCAKFGESFEEYAIGDFNVLRDLAAEQQRAEAGVYANRENDEFLTVCQCNSTHIKGYDGKVLRVRHIMLCPEYDFSEIGIDKYARALSGAFAGVLGISATEMPSPHIKFHFRSPADRQFFEVLQQGLKDANVLSSVEMRGSWLYITK